MQKENLMPLDEYVKQLEELVTARTNQLKVAVDALESIATAETLEQAKGIARNAK